MLDEGELKVMGKAVSGVSSESISSGSTVSGYGCSARIIHQLHK